jgi:cytohesin
MKVWTAIITCVLLVCTASFAPGTFAGKLEDSLFEQIDIIAKAESSDPPAEVNNLPLIEKLLEQGVDVNAKNKDGDTSLVLVTAIGDLDLVELLLEAGANVNATGANGITPLMVSVEAGDDELAEILLSRGADVNAKAKGGWTSLVLACETGSTETIKLLCE